MEFQFDGDSNTFVLDFGDPINPTPVGAAQLRDAIAAQTSIASLPAQTVEVDGSGTQLDPWQIRFAEYQLWHDGTSGSVDLILGDDIETFTISAGATSSDLQASLQGLTSIQNLAEPVVITVSGTGTKADPWKILFTENDASRAVVPTISVSPSNNNLIDVNGLAATVVFAVIHDASDTPALQLVQNSALDSSGDAATVSIAEPSSNHIAKELAEAESFLERVLDIDETEFLVLSHNATSGTEMNLQVDGASDLITISLTATTAEIIAALEASPSFNPTGASTVTVHGSGSPDDPWVIRLFDATGTAHDVPTVGLASSDLLDEVGAAASIDVTSERQEHVDLLLEGTSVILDLGKDFSFSGTDLAFSFDLQHVADQITDPTLKKLFDGASSLISASAEGVVDFSVDGRIDLKVGFDPTQNVGSAVFVTDDSQVTMEVLLDSEELNLGLDLNLDALFDDLNDLLGDDNQVVDILKEVFTVDGSPLNSVGIHVEGGLIAINDGVDEDGNVLPATFNISFLPDNVATTEAGSGDGRYSIFPDLDDSTQQLADGIETQNSGSLLIDLPLFFPTADIAMGGTTEDRNGDGIGDNHLYVSVDDFNAVSDSLNVITPSFRGSIGLFSLLSNVDIVTLIAGGEGDPTMNPFQDGVLGTLQDVLSGDIFGISIPLIGDKLKDEADFIGTFRHHVRDALIAAAAPANDDDTVSTIDVVRGGLFEVFHNLLKILPDVNNDGTIDANDILVSGDNEHVQFNVQIAGDLARTEVDIDFSEAIPGLGLAFPNDKIILDISYNFSLGFGLSLTDGFYFDTSSPGELELDLEATVNEGFEAIAQIAGLELDVTDLGVVDFHGNPSGSGLFGRFYVDLVDTGAGTNGVINDRLTLGELFADSPTVANGSTDNRKNILQAGFEGKADIHFQFDIGIEDSTALPRIDSEFLYTQKFGVGSGAPADPKSGKKSFGGAPTIEFRNIQLDVGSFLHGITGGALSSINKVLGPIMPILNVLSTPIPVVTDLAGDSSLSFLTLAEAFGGGNSKPFFTAVETIISVAKAVENLDTSGGAKISFGNFIVGGANHDLRQDNVMLSDAANQPGQLQGTATQFNDSMFNQSVAHHDQSIRRWTGRSVRKTQALWDPTSILDQPQFDFPVDFR